MPPETNDLRWRVGNVEKRVDRLEAFDFGRLVERLDNHIRAGVEHRLYVTKRMDHFDEEIAGLRKVFIGLMVTIAGSAVIVALTVTLAL